MPSPLDLHSSECLLRRAFSVRRDAEFQEFPLVLLFASLLLGLICASCGAVGSGTTTPPPVTITVMPNSAQPFTGVKVQFRAVVENAPSAAVNWEVNQVPGGNPAVGTIDSTGLYAAPNLVPNPSTVTVTAVLQSDPSKTGSSSVTVQALSSIQGPLTLSPKLSSVTTSQALQLNVLTTGVTNSDVNWAVACVPVGNCAAGTISQDGLFTPPNTSTSSFVTAALKADPSSIGSATVEVTDFPGTLTWRNDNSRSGANSQELALAPATVNSSTFGKLFSCPTDGYAYAQPLFVPNLAIPGNGTHNVIFVATEKDSVFAFDADANPCKELWKTSLIPDGSQAIATPNLTITSTDIVPFVGITSTPVIDLTTFTLYVVAAIQTPGVTPPFTQRLYALDLSTGQPEIKPVGVNIFALDSAFDSTVENQRPALLLANGVVYIAFGSYGGIGSYHGWLFGYDSSLLEQTGVFNVTQPPATQGGIWQSGGGPSADSNGNVFVVTGDGPFNADRTLKSFSYSDSFLRIGTSGGLSVSDYFTPCDQETLQTSGLDVGATAPVLLPDSAGSPSQSNLLLGGSKGGSLYVVNRDNMGKFVPSPCPDLSTRAQTIPVGAGPIMSAPLFWNNAVYVAPGNGHLMSFPMSAGILSTLPFASQSPETLGPQGATPVISWNGSSNDTSSAILWLIDSSGALATPTNSSAILRAYDSNNLSNEIYNSALVIPRDKAGLAAKFTVPTVANGKVYVGTQTELDVYGFLP